jgi:hypothetical protein
VTRDGALVGSVELYQDRAQPWSRFDVRHARLAAHHVAAALARLDDPAGDLPLAVGGGPRSATQ